MIGRQKQTTQMPVRIKSLTFRATLPKIRAMMEKSASEKVVEVKDWHAQCRQEGNEQAVGQRDSNAALDAALCVTKDTCGLRRRSGGRSTPGRVRAMAAICALMTPRISRPRMPPTKELREADDSMFGA